MEVLINSWVNIVSSNTIKSTLEIEQSKKPEPNSSLAEIES